MSGSGLPVERLSLAERVALLDDPERARLFSDPSGSLLAAHLGVSVRELGGLFADERFWLRPAQLQAIRDPAWIVLLMGGRGSGKNRTASNWVTDRALSFPGSRGHLVARTTADVRDVVVGGESGVLACSPPGFVPEYLPSLRKLVWPNGSVALCFTSMTPDQMRGPQSHWTYCDELATWPEVADASGTTAWDHVKLSTRLGGSPQVFVTTTPRRTRQVKELLKQSTEDSRISLHRMSTFDNRANLAPEYLNALLDMYAGSQLERQELYGELVDVVEGALWLERDTVVKRYPDSWPGPPRQTWGTPDGLPDFPLPDPDPPDGLIPASRLWTVVAVDPATSSTAPRSATGIVVCRGTRDPDIEARQAVVLDDLTVPSADPERWGARVAEARRMYSLPGIRRSWWLNRIRVGRWWRR